MTLYEQKNRCKAFKYRPCSGFVFRIDIQQPIYKQTDIACQKVGFDTVFPPDLNGSCFKFRFHDPEVFLNLPALLVDFDDLINITFQIGYNRIKAIILRFL